MKEVKETIMVVRRGITAVALGLVFLLCIGSVVTEAESQIGAEIAFYGKLVDQYSQPVMKAGHHCPV